MQQEPLQKFCHECGEKINIRAEICPKCGVRQPQTAMMQSSADASKPHSLLGQGQPRQKNTAAALAGLLGGLGMHKFYLGQPMLGAIYILFIWTFIPAIFGAIEGLNFWMMSDEVFLKKHSGPAWAKDEFTTIKTSESIPSPDTHVRCPDCRELIFKDAKVCRFCGVKLIPNAQNSV